MPMPLPIVGAKVASLAATASQAASEAPRNLRDVAGRMSQWGPRLMATAFQHIEEFMIAFSIALAGVIVGYIVYRLMTACLGSHGRALIEELGDGKKLHYTQTRNKDTGDLEWQPMPLGETSTFGTDPVTGKETYAESSKILSRWSSTTTWHLFALFLRTLIIIISLYIAFDTIGVDVGSLVASLGIVAAIVTFAARDLIVNTAAAFCIMASGLVQEGMYLMVGPTYRGHVFRIHSMNTLLVEKDGPLGKLVVHSVPNSLFYAVVTSRIIDLEHGIADPKTGLATAEFKKMVLDHVEAVAPLAASQGSWPVPGASGVRHSKLKQVKTV